MNDIDRHEIRTLLAAAAEGARLSGRDTDDLMEWVENHVGPYFTNAYEVEVTLDDADELLASLRRRGGPHAYGGLNA